MMLILNAILDHEIKKINIQKQSNILVYANILKFLAFNNVIRRYNSEIWSFISLKILKIQSFNAITAIKLFY